MYHFCNWNWYTLFYLLWSIDAYSILKHTHILFEKLKQEEIDRSLGQAYMSRDDAQQT